VSLKLQENANNADFAFEKIKPSKLSEVIDKAYIVLKTTIRGARRPPKHQSVRAEEEHEKH
jgi:hypothetical protein